jgi:hypothetical protein
MTKLLLPLTLSLAGFFGTTAAFAEVKGFPCELYAESSKNDADSLLEHISKWQNPSDTTIDFCQTVKKDLINLRNVRTWMNLCVTGDELGRARKNLDELDNFTTNMLKKVGC